MELSEGNCELLRNYKYIYGVTMPRRKQLCKQNTWDEIGQKQMWRPDVDVVCLGSHECSVF